MSAFLELAERCEKATGPDRQLDGEIAAALGAEVQCVRVGPDYRREEVAEIDRASGAAPISRPVKHFTASIDAATTLVPEGSTVELNLPVRLPPRARVNDEMCVAATAALALCAAALRARAA